MANIALGKFIANKRKEHRLTQEQLAELVDTSTGYIGALEIGNINLPKKATRQKLAVALGIHPNDILDAAGVTEPTDDTEEITQELVDDKIRELGALPIEQRMDELKRYSPALYEFVRATVFDLSLRGAVSQHPPAPQPEEDQPQDRNGRPKHE